MRLARWAMWNRWHLAATILVGVVLVGLFASCGLVAGPEPDDVEPTPTATSRPLFTPTPTESPAVTPVVTPTSEPTPTPVETPDTGKVPAHEEEVTLDPMVTVAAEGFVAAWLDIEDPDWPAVDKFATADLALALEATDPRNVPAGEVSGTEITTKGLGYAEVTVLIGEDRTVNLVLTETAVGWKVRQILP